MVGFNTIVAGLHSFGVAIGDAFTAPTQKIKAIATSTVGQGIIGVGLGVGMHKVSDPLTDKFLEALGISPTNSGTYYDNVDIADKILFAPVTCLLFPVLEEKVTGWVQEKLKIKFESYFASHGFLDSTANLSARVMSVFFASVFFGIAHFTDAIILRSNPAPYVPQVVATFFMGLMFGLSKDISGGLSMATGMHIGHNTYCLHERWVTFVDLYRKNKISV